MEEEKDGEKKKSWKIGGSEGSLTFCFLFPVFFLHRLVSLRAGFPVLGIKVCFLYLGCSKMFLFLGISHYCG